jgi:fibro-slime domain-containing protein
VGREVGAVNREVGAMSRAVRAVRARGLRLGAASGVLGAALIACGGGSENDELPATESTSGAQGSASAASGGAPPTTAGVGAGGSIDFTSSSGGAGSGGDPCGQVGETMLVGKLRDFKEEHPDFEYVIGVDPGIVKDALGSDGKPVYNGNPTTPTTNGAASFNEWYNDVPSVNVTLSYTLPLTKGADDVYRYDNPAFFPLDGLGWGNEGHGHNYHFTLELHTKFLYQGGEKFSFTGDDDLFVFVNGRLGIDLGGVHGAMTGAIDLDQSAAQLGLQIGKIYALDFFFAERHLVESNFHVETTIGFVDCGPPK